MQRLTQTQAGVFFGILASALILVLTAMALFSLGAPRHGRQALMVAAIDTTPIPTPTAPQNVR